MPTSACGEEARTEPTGRQGKAATECVRNAPVSLTLAHLRISLLSKDSSDSVMRACERDQGAWEAEDAGESAR